MLKSTYYGDNHIPICHLGRYIVGYTFGNYVLRLADAKQNFRPYIRRYTSPNDKFEYSYPLIVGLLIEHENGGNRRPFVNIFLLFSEAFDWPSDVGEMMVVYTNIRLEQGQTTCAQNLTEKNKPLSSLVIGCNLSFST